MSFGNNGFKHNIPYDPNILKFDNYNRVNHAVQSCDNIQSTCLNCLFVPSQQKWVECRSASPNVSRRHFINSASHPSDPFINSSSHPYGPSFRKF